MKTLTALGLGLVLLAGVFVLLLYRSPSSEESLEKAPVLFEAPDFQLTDSSGNSFSNSRLEGSVWLADFIFTRCTGPCPLMTQRMLSIQEALKEKGLWSRVELVSITVDPGYDSPEVLRDYADTWGADTSGWHFLTGPEDYTIELIRDGFKITAQREGSGSMDVEEMPNIIHGTSFLLVDKAGNIRHVFSLGEPDLTEKVVSSASRLVDESYSH
jgi:protein SCO1/2